MDPAQTPLLFVLLILLIGSAIASASETALFGITHGQRAMLRRTNPRLSKIVESLLARPRELLMQVLLLNMVVNVSYFIVTSILTIRAESATMKVVISVASLAVIVLIGEVFAKLFASSATILFLRFAAPIHILIRKPIRVILVRLDRYMIAPMSRLLAPSRSTQARSQVSVDQMGALIAMSASDGVIDSGEQELLNSIVSLGHMRVEQVMTPRVDAAWINLTSSYEEIIDCYRETKRTLLVVFEDGLDSPVVGVVNARKVLEGGRIEDVMDKPMFVPEQCRLDVLIERFRKSGVVFAVCVDEHGGMSGVVTIADLVKELIDSSGSANEDLGNDVEMVGVGRWIVPGRLAVRDWAMMFADPSIVEHAKRVNTLGGLVMVLLDQVPQVGDVASIGDLELRVVEMENRSIERIEVQVVVSKNQTQASETKNTQEQRRSEG